MQSVVTQFFILLEKKLRNNCVTQCSLFAIQLLFQPINMSYPIY